MPDEITIDLKFRGDVEALHKFISNQTIASIEPMEAINPLRKLYDQLGEYLDKTDDKS